MHFLGLDVGSSSVKVVVIDGNTGARVASASHPPEEMSISAPRPGWAEQDPALWWEGVRICCQRLLQAQPGLADTIGAIGITYQMHGLVAVDKDQQVLRPAIIWCDSRAVATGEAAFQALGRDWCMAHLLNSPGNFTAAKLRWVAENQPELYQRIDKILLPGDYIALKLTGECTTTESGLSEAVLWDFTGQQLAQPLLDHWHIDAGLIPRRVPNLGGAGELSTAAARELGLKAGIPLAFRAGDQVANALSLNVLEPGEVATTAGTSGVIYAVAGEAIADPEQRINTFVHVRQGEQPRQGLLACINGAGRMNSWLRGLLGQSGATIGYAELNTLAETAEAGSDGLQVLPFGNGAERLLQNRVPGAQIRGLDLNRHGLGQIARAAQEGVACAMNMGFEVIKQLGAETHVVRAGHANMFLSPIFTQAFVNLTQAPLELYHTDGAEGAARAAAWGSGFYRNRAEVYKDLQRIRVVEPEPHLRDRYQDIYGQWCGSLEQLLTEQSAG